MTRLQAEHLPEATPVARNLSQTVAREAT